MPKVPKGTSHKIWKAPKHAYKRKRRALVALKAKRSVKKAERREWKEEQDANS